MTPIPGMEGYYASDDGDIYSTRSVGVGARLGLSRAPRRLAPKRAGAGYLQVSLGRGVYRYVHRLIAETFIGPAADGFEVMHIDGDKSNNRASNLRWGTRQENMRDNVRLGVTTKGEKNRHAKLTTESVREIRRLVGGGDRVGVVAKRFGVTSSTVSVIVAGKTWKESA